MLYSPAPVKGLPVIFIQFAVPPGNPHEGGKHEKENPGGKFEILVTTIESIGKVTGKPGSNSIVVSTGTTVVITCS